MKPSKHLSDMEQMCAQSFIWDAHAGIFPDPKINLNLLDAWRENSVDYVSINVGFDVMDWQQTIATLAAYRNWVLVNDDRFILEVVGKKHLPNTQSMIEADHIDVAI